MMGFAYLEWDFTFKILFSNTKIILNSIFVWPAREVRWLIPVIITYFISLSVERTVLFDCIRSILGRKGRGDSCLVLCLSGGFLACAYSPFHLDPHFSYLNCNATISLLPKSTKILLLASLCTQGKNGLCHLFHSLSCSIVSNLPLAMTIRQNCTVTAFFCG